MIEEAEITPEQHRKLVSIEMEQVTLEELKQEFPPEAQIHNDSWNGADFIVTHFNDIMCIELKTIKETIREKSKKAKSGYTNRKGRFCLAAHQLDYDVFIFKIRYSDKNIETFFLSGEHLKNFITNSKNLAAKTIKMSIKELMDLKPRKNLSYFIKKK